MSFRELSLFMEMGAVCWGTRIFLGRLRGEQFFFSLVQRRGPGFFHKVIWGTRIFFVSSEQLYEGMGFLDTESGGPEFSFILSEWGPEFFSFHNGAPA